MVLVSRMHKLPYLGKLGGHEICSRSSLTLLVYSSGFKLLGPRRLILNRIYPVHLALPEIPILVKHLLSQRMSLHRYLSRLIPGRDLVCKAQARDSIFQL